VIPLCSAIFKSCKFTPFYYSVGLGVLSLREDRGVLREISELKRPEIRKD
jgi:hypothetical protein